MKKKDVLFICQYFYPEYISSATLPFDTAKKLSDVGFSVDALVGYPKEYNIINKQEIKLKETINSINIRRLKYLTLSRESKLGRIVNYFSFTCAVLLNIFKLKKYKVIMFYSNPPILPLVSIIAKKLFRVKLVFVSYDVYPEIALKTNAIKENGIIAKAMNFINQKLFKNLDRAVALSSEMEEFIIKNRDINKDKVVVIPNWYAPEEDAAALNLELISDKVKESFSGNHTYVSYFGNMGICQDIETIVQTIVKLENNKEIKFVFAGHGNKVKDLKNIVASQKLDNVIIFDFLHGDDYKYALKNSSVLLVSLEKEISGLAVPSKTYSYMMAGKPIISIMDRETDIAEMLEISKSGFNVEPGKVNHLVEVISNLNKNVDQQDLMGKNCKKLFLDNYTTDICTDKYVNLIKELIN